MAGREAGPARADHDRLVAEIYRAGAGLLPWTEALDNVRVAFGLWIVHFVALDMRRGSIAFSYEVGNSPEAGLDWLRKYHRVDPRVALLPSLRVGQWFACDEHFDEAFVARDPFYTEFLIPYGGRFIYAAKLQEDSTHTLVMAYHRGRGHPQVSREERPILESLGWHCANAFRVREEMARADAVRSFGLSLLESMRQPLLVLDEHRRIIAASRAGRELLARGELIEERNGYAVCRSAENDTELMLTLREMLSPTGAAADQDRRGLRLRSIEGRGASTLLALRPHETMGAFGRVPLGALVIHESGRDGALDPFLLELTFDLTPAEARLAVLIVNGRSPEQCAADLRVKVSTIRSQLLAVFAKTGAGGQADLVRLVLGATSI